ncbi:MAG: hypothetical protein HC888_07960 [Candidatus Competibacteraceae bacterium]|nr:hypothetical protein [Candidatus Competibacteraceae bacterium]
MNTAEKTEKTNPAQDIFVDVRLRLTESEISFCEEAKGKNSLGPLASYFLKMYASGGYMLKGVEVAELNGLIEGGMETARDLLTFIRDKAGRPEGKIAYRVLIDPALQPSLEDKARACGMPLDLLIESGFNEMLVNGWIMNLEPKGGILYLTQEQRDRLNAAMGKERWNTSDLVDMVSPVVPPPPPVVVADETEKPKKGK